MKRLEQEGLLVRNKAVAWRRPTLRILCIGKRESDGCRDAPSILKRSGFRFECTILNVAVQGIAAVPTLLDAFAQLIPREQEFDVVLLIRGGGSELDLVAYDDYEVAKAVALSGLPVITGLGHTADQSMCDMVSYKSLETPTAAARFLVDQIQVLMISCVSGETGFARARWIMCLDADGTCCRSAPDSDGSPCQWSMTGNVSGSRNDMRSILPCGNVPNSLVGGFRSSPSHAPGDTTGAPSPSDAHHRPLSNSADWGTSRRLRSSLRLTPVPTDVTTYRALHRRRTRAPRPQAASSASSSGWLRHGAA
ncbi:MAG: hypothetical protein H0W13_05640, partial [Nitrospirales bacterium]|nr:hypothetical protein [Nitrospirales bacterium]